MNELHGLTQETFEYLINHIVFPIKLPQQSFEEDVLYEIYFLKLIKLVIRDMKIENGKQLNISNEFNQIVSLVDSWNELQGKSNDLESKVLCNQIKSLKENQSLAVYLRAQNSCLLIKIQESNVVLSTFQASLENSQIMTTDTEIEVEFPSKSIVSDSFQIIRSTDFANLLKDLTKITMEESQSTTYKANSDHEEVRDVANNKLITEFIFAMLVSNSDAKQSLPKKLVKKYRDDVLLSSSLLPFRRSGK